MTPKGKDFFNQYYALNCRLLTIIGLWPYQRSLLQKLRIFQICVVMAICITAQIWLLQTSEKEMKLITEVLQTLLPTLCYSCACISILCNYTTMKKALDCIKIEWEKLRGEEESTIMQMYAAESKRYTQAIACAFYLYVVFLIFPSTLRYILYFFGKIEYSKLTLPVHNDAFLKNKILYIGMFWFQLTSITTLCTVGVAHYTTFLLFLQHTCALFTIVTVKLDRPFKKSGLDFDTTSTLTKSKDEFDWIVDVTKCNNNAIHFLELIKVIYETAYIIDAILGLFLIIINFLYIFQLLDSMLTTIEALKICMYIISTLLVIYAYFHIGQRLIDHSIGVHTKCCLIPFYTLSIKTQRLLLLLTMRTMKPSNISIGGIIVASHELFIKMMRASFSFATIFYKGR